MTVAGLGTLKHAPEMHLSLEGETRDLPPFSTSVCLLGFAIKRLEQKFFTRTCFLEISAARIFPQDKPTPSWNWALEVEGVTANVVLEDNVEKIAGNWTKQAEKLNIKFLGCGGHTRWDSVLRHHFWWGSGDPMWC